MLRKPGSLSAVAAFVAALAAPAAHAEWGLNMTRGVTQISRDVYSLHMTILWWCVAIAIFVFGWMLVSLVKKYSGTFRLFGAGPWRMRPLVS